MWQVNGFDRRCFQVGRGYRILPSDVGGSESQLLSSQPEINALIVRAQQLSLEGSDAAAVEAAAEAAAKAKLSSPELLAEVLRRKATLQRRQAEHVLDGPTQQQLLKAAGQEIEAEAAQFHKAKFTKGVALMRLSLAQIDLQHGGLCRCCSAAELAQDALNELPDGDPSLLEAKLLRATALLASGDPGAQADAQEVLEKSRKAGVRRWEAMALHVFGLSKALQGTLSAYEDALRHLATARNLFRELQMWSCHSSVELSMARLYLESQQPQQAVQVTEEALVMIQDHGDFHSEYLAYGLLCQAILDVDTDVSQAEERAREAVQRLKAKGPRPHAMALNLLAGVLSETKLNSATAPVQEALAISQRLKDKDLEAQMWLRLSSIEAAHEKDDETLQALEKAMELWKQLPEKAEAIACARYLSISVLLRMFDPKDSLKEASQVRAFFAEEKDAYREALTLVAVASVSFARNDAEDAKESCELARELFREVSDHRGEMLALTTLAEMTRSLGEISEASELMQRCRSMAKDTGWKEEEVRILVDLANLERATSAKSSARLAREGLRLAKHTGHLEGQVQLLMQCVQCNLVLASEKAPPSRNLLEETHRLATDAVVLTGDLGRSGWRRRLKGLALYWQAHSVALRDTSDALKHLEALVNFCRSTDNVGLEAHARLLEAQIYLSSDKAKALEILRPAAETLKKLGDVNGVQMAEQVLERASPPKQPARPALEAPALESEALVSAPAPAATPSTKLDQYSVRKLILDLATEAVASEAPLQDDSVLMDLGMDSLTSVAFRNDLQMKFGMELPASLIFEYPSVGELTKLVMSLSDQ